MLLWIIIALLTAAAILAVLAPLARAPKSRASAAYAARVYRDQLHELERDAADGRISASEAKMARAEIARRLIALDDEARTRVGQELASPSGGSTVARRAVSLVALIGIPALSLGFYLALGAPDKPGEPLAARLSAPVAPDNVELLVAKVEAHLAKHPEDGRGWEVIAPVYLNLGRAADATQAFRTAIRILGPSAERNAGLGEAIVTAEGGIVTAEARGAFEAAEALDPKAPAPRFYLALAAEQAGKPEEAKKVLRALLADAPADAPWRPAVEEALAKGGPGRGAADASRSDAGGRRRRSEYDAGRPLRDDRVDGDAARRPPEG